ncbi:hypothetical protein JCM9492_11470 [Aquifex pyrophilus]
MEVFHVVATSSALQAMRLFDDKTLNFLISAYAIENEPRILKNKELIRRKGRLLFADSGLLSWIKKSKAWEYACSPDRVLELQLSINPDIVATLDHPCEPSIIEKSGTTTRNAISVSIYNALWLVERKEAGDERLKDKIVAIVVQGYEKADYEWCIREYRRMGFFDLPADQYWFAIGSVCMRKPPELYEIVKFVRERIPAHFHVHCFGIASPNWILKLKEFGVNSIDSSTGAMAGTLSFSFLDEGGQYRKLKLKKRNKHMTSAMIAFNWASLDFQVKEGIKPVFTLFEEVRDAELSQET